MNAAVGHSVDQELNPWLSAEARFSEAANRLNLDEGIQKVLRTPTREITVAIPVQLDEAVWRFSQVIACNIPSLAVRGREVFVSRLM